ncbi:ABC transporter ATP-binding protein [soil metagenome]
MESILTVKNLHKRFGSIHAVNDLSLTVDKGNVFGILGPNGSGKTTTLGMLLDIIIPTKGEFYWFGQPSSTKTRQRIGAILETPNFYPYLSAYKNLKIIAEVKNAPPEDIPRVLEFTNLKSRQKDAYKTFSLGMKQRLALAAALLNNPEVLILDEPTNGLDPQGIAEVREIISRVAGEGTTVILASHLLDEVQKVCTHFAVLKSGKKIYFGPVEETMTEASYVEVAAPDMDSLKSVINLFPAVISVNTEEGKLVVKLAPESNSKELNGYLHEKGIIISHLLTRRKSLEKQFLEILEEVK